MGGKPGRLTGTTETLGDKQAQHVTLVGTDGDSLSPGEPQDVEEQLAILAESRDLLREIVFHLRVMSGADDNVYND